MAELHDIEVGDSRIANLETAEDLYVVFDGPPGPESGRFVEVEDAQGRSVGAIGWREREDGYWVLGPFKRGKHNG